MGSYGSLPPVPSSNPHDPPRHHFNGFHAASSQQFGHGNMDGDIPAQGTTSLTDHGFDILEWYPAYLSCQKYFLDHAQYEVATQAVCALINIRLPFQWTGNPVTQSNRPQSSSDSMPPGGSSNFNFSFGNRAASSALNNSQTPRNGTSDKTPNHVSPIPYIRRLVVTGFDKPAILHGFFGDDYNKGIMPHVESERRNYLFTAKHGGWRTCKKQYDFGSGGGADETVPFLKPLDEANVEELAAAEKAWSSWLAMEDWMVGPRAPQDDEQPSPHSRAAARGGAWHSRTHSGLPDGM